MMAILNVFRYAGGTVVAIFLFVFLMITAVVIFFIMSAYTSVFTSYLTFTTPIRALTLGFENAYRQFTFNVHQYWDVVLSCYKFFLYMSKFSLVVLIPFFKKLGTEIKQ